MIGWLKMIKTLLAKIMGITFEYNLDAMLEDGWVDTGESHQGHSIYSQGDERILYDLDRDEIIARYDAKDGIPKV